MMKYAIADKVFTVDKKISIEVIGLCHGPQHPTGQNHYTVYVNGKKAMLSEEILDEFWKIGATPLQYNHTATASTKKKIVVVPEDDAFHVKQNEEPVDTVDKPVDRIVRKVGRPKKST